MRTSLVSFMDFNVMTGPSRARIPAAVRAMYEDPVRHPWDYYGPMVTAIVAGFADETDLRARVERACLGAEQSTREGRFRGRERHFAELAAGALRLRGALPVRSVDRAPTGMWRHGDLEVRVTPHMVVERRNGVREVWFLYLKEASLSQGAADPALVILSDVMADGGHVDLVPRVVDVRRAAGYTLTRNRSVPRLRSFLVGEAELFARFWDLAA